MGKHKTQAEREIALRVGARIRQLREIQHISQIHLATEIGIRAGPLGWIEKGKHLPSGRVLYRIARQLNVRIDDLFQEADVWQQASPASEAPAVILPPADVSAPAEEVKAAHIVCQSVADRLVDLEKMSGGVKVSSLPLFTPFEATETGAEYLAASARQGLGIGSVVVADVLEQIEDAGVRVVFLDMPDGCLSFGGYDRANRNAFIFLNSRAKKQPEALVFRLAFELGRIYWYTRKLFSGSDEAEAVEGAEARLSEVAFAGRFAAAFLMPALALRAAVGSLGLTPKAWSWDLLLNFKRRYGVSAQVFAQRLQSLKLTWSDKQKKSPRFYQFKDEIDAFVAENGALSEPGGSRPVLTMNAGLSNLLLRAEQLAGKDQKPLNAIKRVLRQSCVRLDA